jgi:hypothetical protein
LWEATSLKKTSAQTRYKLDKRDYDGENVGEEA